MNRNEVARLLAVACAACPSQAARIGKPEREQMADAYTALLADVTYEAANAALHVLLKTSNWIPSVAEIRAAVQELARGPVTAGGEAWGSVLRAMKAQGANRVPGVDFVFRDPVTAKCVTALGWRELCLCDDPSAARADRARFIELYDREAAQGHRESVAPALSAARVARQLAGDPFQRALDAAKAGGS